MLALPCRSLPPCLVDNCLSSSISFGIEMNGLSVPTEMHRNDRNSWNFGRYEMEFVYCIDQRNGMFCPFKPVLEWY